MINFYFKRKILSLLDSPEKQDKETLDKAESGAEEFIEKYGSYLNLYEALNAASEKFSPRVIRKLLELATHDPVHIDYMKLFYRTGTFVPYESRVLSCLLASLSSPRKEGRASLDLLAMLVTAYPDVKPWQLRSEQLHIESNCWESLTTAHLRKVKKDDVIFYYDYLSQLMENSHMARSDVSLVNEWCFLSTTTDITWQDAKRKKNFLSVASGEKNGKKLKFARDLGQLSIFSNDINEHSLTLKLANEIVSKSSSYCNHDVMKKMMETIHNVSMSCLSNTKVKGDSPFDTDLMTDILKLLNSIASSPLEIVKESMDITIELGVILDQCKEQEKDGIEKEESLLSLIATIIPSSLTLKALSDRNVEHIPKGTIISALRTSLEKGSKEGQADEISNALIHLRKIRPQRQPPTEKYQTDIWNKMLLGTAVINK